MEFTGGGRLEVRITPDDVGKRVSVRSLTGDRVPGARFTDTVGVLTSWTSGVLEITRRDGRIVALPEDDVVAAKTVPAAPARRRGVPAAGAHELQRVAAQGWPALETERLGEWTLRAAHGFTSRANSVLPMGDPGTGLDAALERVTRWYDARALPAKIQVTTGDVDDDRALARALDERGWTAERHAVLRTGALAPLADRAPDPRVRLHRTPGDAWLGAYRRAEGAAGDAALRVLCGGPSVWFATVPGGASGAGAEEPGTGPVAIGRCVVAGRWAGFAAVEVTPGHRRQGLATVVMAELARRALREGASAAYLQVETGNAAALALYDRLGFADHHAYHYRRAPQRSTP
ncbi:GNAT family N-acetyltransferase [Streptomyces sp. DSM 42041]|uniref:GNAT family N-acetyltransferase n=1 Tax=Streptomyces hazeniae TaxID=3075538 RepID=A0ABU2NLX5_9ACTN|nr:GNAT family N-acetyltransferase [Streptomyces sp. DSM 42041]MDT0377981.1 GNAT family N-acetyltransferase [Streptomyces sp. DSM 42041]